MLKLLGYLLGLPFVVLFGIALHVRHTLYDWGLLRSRSFDFPVICVGNLAVGGTGKTPHTLLIAEIMQHNNIQFAVLLRGYKRTSKGFRYVETTDTATVIGDEPLLIKRNFTGATVAVCKDRASAISRIKQDNPGIAAVILDDAFQHRRVNAGMSLLLTPYDRLFTQDMLLPFGRLRDLSQRRRKADVVVVSRCPETLKPFDYKVLHKNLKLLPYQQMYCTYYRYTAPVLLSTGSEATLKDGDSVIAIAGIANPQPFIEYMAKKYKLQRTLVFADHHRFGESSVKKIRQALAQYPHASIVTTEKDAMRLLCCGLRAEELQRVVYQPVTINFLEDKQDKFSQNILDYVRTNKGSSIFC
jgi:tetraacyldisaccharide 4'-kinase